MFQKLNNQKTTFIFYLFVALLLFFFTLTPNYIEGDDATTILYHAAGRHPEIQRPYAPYNSGMDFVLSFIDSNNELLLKKTAFYLSFFSGIACLFLTVLVFKQLLKLVKVEINYLFFIFLPLICPELLFNLLVQNSSNISYFFALLSLYYFLLFLDKDIKKFLLFSAFVFALSIPFRWSMLTLFPVFLGIYLFIKEIDFIPEQIASSELSK